MAEEQILLDTADRIFADFCNKALWDSAERGEFPQRLWGVLAEHGFDQLALAESGVALSDVFGVIRSSGRHALPLPLPELLLAARWSGDAGLASVGLAEGEEVRDVPWGREAPRVVAVGLDGACHLVEGADVVPAANAAGEARDRLRGGRWAPLDSPPEGAFELLALCRAVQSAGVLDRVLALCLQYAAEREQFGRPIARFQAIQHMLAVMAAEVAAAGRAADAAVDALGSDRFALDVAAAKTRVGEAAGIVAEHAHQVHGAMGYTHEHQLHHFTRRLWAWRDEFGNETYWQQRLGTHLAGLGAERVWDFLASPA